MEESIKKEKDTQYEKALNEILNENIDVQSQGKDVEKFTSKYTDYDKTNNMLLKYYNERNENDFEKALKAQLTTDVYKKLKGKLNGIDKDISKQEQEEQIRDISKEALEGEQVDKDIKERAIKKVQEEVGEDSEIDFKAEVFKAIYEEAFDRYSALLEKYKMKQLRDESMTVGDKEGTELVLYEKYLTNLEKNYAGYAKSKGLDVRTLSEDPTIKAKKEKLEYDMKKMTRSNDLSVEDNIQRIRILEERRNAVAEKMSELAENRQTMSPEQFKQSMDYYQQEYFELTVELRSQDPSLEVYKSQIMQENENIEFSNREIGVRDDKIVAGSYQEIDSYGETQEDLSEDNLEEIQNIDEDYALTSQDAIDDMIKQAKYALECGDIEGATEIIESAESITFGRVVAQSDTEEQMPEENDEQVEDEMEQNKDGESNNTFMQEMESGVASDKEARLQERIRELEEHLTIDENEMKKEQSDIEQVHVRTRFNKKN